MMSRLLPPALLATLALTLAACGGSSGSGTTGTPPSLNPSLSTPSLTATVQVGQSQQTLYVHFSDATNQYISSNPDSLQNISVDSSGATGAVIYTPPATSGSSSGGTTPDIPGIYSVGITASNAWGSLTELFNLNLLPAGQLQLHPTVIPFDMNGLDTNSQTVTIGLRNGIINQSLQNVQLLADSGATGIVIGNGSTSNGITVTQNGTADQGTIQADITITKSTLSTSSATDSNGTSYSNGILLRLTALPESSNGFSAVPYSEWVYIVPN